MKKMIFLGLALALLLGQAGNASAQSIDIIYDGYCDGAHFEFNLTTGVVSGNKTGCVSGPMAGTVGMPFGGGTPFIACTDQTGESHSFKVMRGDGTWTFYRNDGNGTYVWNSGTWTTGVAMKEFQGEGVSSDK